MTEQTNTTLLISARPTEDSQLMWRAAIQRGWSVERIRGMQIPEVHGDRVAVYIESLFAPTIARQLGLELIQTPEFWLQDLPEEYRKRDVALTTLAEVSQRLFPLFIKPPNEKSFPAQVYDNADTLLKDYEPETSLLVATPVEWSVEFRCFCLDGQVRTLSPYLRNGQLAKPDEFSATDDELRTYYALT